MFQARIRKTCRVGLILIRDDRTFRSDPVVAEIFYNCRSRRVDDALPNRHNENVRGASEDWQSIRHGAGRLGRTIPSDHNSTS